MRLKTNGKYKMKSLIESTPEDHVDYKPLMKAQSAIKKLVTLVNEKTKEVENLDRLNQLQKKYFSTTKIDLVSEKRTFIRETSVLVQDKIEKKNSILLLFNDSILVFRQKKVTVKIYLQSLLVDIQVTEIRDQNSFDITSSVRFFKFKWKFN